MGHDCAYVPDDNQQTCDAMATSLLSSGRLKTIYIVPSMYPRNEFTVGMISPGQNVVPSVRIGDEFGAEIISYTDSIPLHTTFKDHSAVTITGSHKMLVTLLGHSSSDDFGDASMTFVPSSYQYTNFYQFYVPPAFSNDSVLCIVIYDRYDVAGLRLNDKEINPVKSSSVVLPCAGRFYI